MNQPNSAAMVLGGEEIIQQFARLIIQCLHWNTRYYHTRKVYHNIEMELYEHRFTQAQQYFDEEKGRREEKLRRERVHASLQARRKLLAKRRRSVLRGKTRVAALRAELREAGAAATQLVAPTSRIHSTPWEIVGFPPDFKFNSPLVTPGNELREWSELMDMARVHREHAFFVPLRLLHWCETAEERCKKVQALTITGEASMMPGIKQRYLKLRGR